MQRVHNTTAYSIVVARTGRRVLAFSSDTIDVSEPRAEKAIRAGKLILVNTAPAPAPEPEPTPEDDGGATSESPEPTSPETATPSA